MATKTINTVPVSIVFKSLNFPQFLQLDKHLVAVEMEFVVLIRKLRNAIGRTKTGTVTKLG